MTDSISESFYSLGIEAFHRERQHQVQDKGYTPKHDDEHHDAADLIRAGTCYAEFASNDLEGVDMDQPHVFWPEGMKWNPGDSAVEALQKAGAFLAAGYDKLMREMGL